MLGQPGRRALAANLLYDNTALEVQIEWGSQNFGVVGCVVLKEAVSETAKSKSCVSTSTAWSSRENMITHVAHAATKL